MPAAERRTRVVEVMDRMGIGHRAKHMPGQLSGGQQQRVAVARAVVGDQPLILADEPTGNLDSAHGQEVMELLRSLNREGTTIVMVTHSPSHADYARRTVNLFDGHVVTDAIRAPRSNERPNRAGKPMFWNNVKIAMQESAQVQNVRSHQYRWLGAWPDDLRVRRTAGQV